MYPNQTPYPHLKISENIYDAIHSASKEEWEEFFKSIKTNKLSTIETCLDSDLTKERGKLTMVNEVQGIFLGIQQHKKTKPND